MGLFERPQEITRTQVYAKIIEKKVSENMYLLREKLGSVHRIKTAR